MKIDRPLLDSDPAESAKASRRVLLSEWFEQADLIDDAALHAFQNSCNISKESPTLKLRKLLSVIVECYHFSGKKEDFCDKLENINGEGNVWCDKASAAVNTKGGIICVSDDLRSRFLAIMLFRPCEGAARGLKARYIYTFSWLRIDQEFGISSLRMKAIVLPTSEFNNFYQHIKKNATAVGASDSSSGCEISDGVFMPLSPSLN